VKLTVTTKSQAVVALRMIEKIDKKRRRGQKSDRVTPDDSVENYQAHKTPLIQLDDDAPTWYEYGKNLPGRNDTITTDPPGPMDQPNRNFITKCRSIGDIIFQQEMQLIGKGSSADDRWVENTMRKGTLKDRIAAMSVTVSSDPIHKFYALDGLLSMVGCSESGGKANSRVAQLTAEALDDLFLNSFLPAGRKLFTLAQRPLYRYEAKKDGTKSKKTLSPRILLLWRFEEMIKEKFELYLRKYMSQTLQEGAEMQKASILQAAGNLLSSVPEGESILLSMMVNKLGDPSKKTASTAGHHLRLVLQKHPNMQLIVAREVQQLAHRPHLSPRALYNCIVFLNQLKLTKDDTENETLKKLQDESLAASLIKTYFRLFEVTVNDKKGKQAESEGAHMKSRLLSALLYVPSCILEIPVYALWWKHLTFSISYRTGVNRAHPYLPEENKDMEEHIDALYRVVHTAAPTACTQALMLLFHLAVGTKDDADEDRPREEEKQTKSESLASNTRKDRFYCALYATLSKPSLVSHGKHLTMYFNLLYKAMKFDTDANRIHAFAKRLMCTVLHCKAPPIAGSLFLLNEIAKTHDGLRIGTQDPPTESDSMVFLDENKRDPRSALNLWKPDSPITRDDNDAREKHGSRMTLFPPSWELSLIVHHFHPSVARFARTIGDIEFAGDPLKDFGLAPFLDKFAYRNPKSRDKVASHLKRGESIAERRSGTDDLMRSRLQLPMNDPAFLQRDDVSEQDEFFQRFFVERARRDEIKGIVRGGSNSNAELEEEELETAQDAALDAAEAAEGLDAGKDVRCFVSCGSHEMDHTMITLFFPLKFEEYERAWESDPEEEAFVDSLALKLLEDSADGPVDIDDDPDMDEWGDMYSDGVDEKPDEESSDEEHALVTDVVKDSDDDVDSSVMDGGHDDDSAGKVQDDDDFMDAADSDDSDDIDCSGPDVKSFDGKEYLSKGRLGRGDENQKVGGDDSADDDDDLLFVDGDSSDDEPKPKKKAKKNDTFQTFADADDYAEMIDKDFKAVLRGSPVEVTPLEGPGSDSKRTKTSKKKKRRSKS
jgi:ribosome biogenesis protein MAK21